MTHVNQILQAKDKPDLIVVGATESGTWLVQPSSFGSGPREITAEETTAYGVDSSPERGSEAEGWRRLGGFNRDGTPAQRRAIIPERPQSPEEAFAAGTASPVTAQDAHGVTYVVGA